MLDRFKARTRIDEATGCWEWTGAKDEWGYGRFSVGGVTKRAHRVSYEIHCGQIPDGMHVLHACDNPSCVCPHHLFVGTNLDNIADKVAKCRQRGPSECEARGEKHGQAKLTEGDVIAIRSSVGATLQELADQYGISNQQVSRIRARKRWAHVV